MSFKVQLNKRSPWFYLGFYSITWGFTKFITSWIAPFWSDYAVKPSHNFTRLTNSTDLALPWMIYAMNDLKMMFLWIVSIVFLFIKKLDVQTKLVLKTDGNMQTKNHHYQFRKLDFVIHLIFVIRRVFVYMQLSSKLELIYIYIYIIKLILLFNFYINL